MTLAMQDTGMRKARSITCQLGGSWRGHYGNAPCPVCQPERRRKQTALSISEGSGKILLHCFKSGCSFSEITNAIPHLLETAQNDFGAYVESVGKQAANSTNNLANARALWDSTRTISGTIAENYLRRRNITIRLPDNLRFIPDVFHAQNSSWACAMIANVEPTGGVHRTYFTKKGKRFSENAKMMLGPCSGGAVQLSEGVGPLVVCEGIETGLSLVQMLSERSPKVWAALSTGGIRALTLPCSSRDLIVATDGDDPGRAAGNTLASRATALGWKTSMVSAPIGQDWNDVLMQHPAAHGQI